MTFCQLCEAAFGKIFQKIFQKNLREAKSRRMLESGSAAVEFEFCDHHLLFARKGEEIVFRRPHKIFAEDV